MKPKKPKGVEPLLYDLVMADCAAGKRLPFIFSRVIVDPNAPLMSYWTRRGPASDRNTPHGSLSIHELLRSATVFVVSEDAMTTALGIRAAMMARGTTRERQKDITAPMAEAEKVEGLTMPDLAIVPFSVTWLEYDPRQKVPEYVPELTCAKVGHMIIRDRFCALALTFEQNACEGPSPHSYVMLPFTMRWTSSDALHGEHAREEFGWLKHQMEGWYWHDGHSPEPIQLPKDVADGISGALLTGKGWLPAWHYRFGGDWHQPVKKGEKLDLEVVGGILEQELSTASMLMMILSLVAWCPIEYRTVTVAGRRMVARMSRRLVTHQTVTSRSPFAKRCDI